MEKKYIVFIILIALFLYFQFNTRESFVDVTSEASIRKQIMDIYRVDVAAIKNMVEIANAISKTGQFKIPTNLTISGKINTDQTITATGSISSVGNMTSRNMTASDAITANGVLTGGTITTSGSVTSGSLSTGSINASSISAAGNISTNNNITVGGTANITGEIVSKNRNILNEIDTLTKNLADTNTRLDNIINGTTAFSSNVKINGNLVVNGTGNFNNETIRIEPSKISSSGTTMEIHGIEFGIDTRSSTNDYCNTNANTPDSIEQLGKKFNYIKPKLGNFGIQLNANATLHYYVNNSGTYIYGMPLGKNNYRYCGPHGLSWNLT